eukprot:1159273-Pelagomonas_calceolata.AAC.2
MPRPPVWWMQAVERQLQRQVCVCVKARLLSPSILLIPRLSLANHRLTRTPPATDVLLFQPPHTPVLMSRSYPCSTSGFPFAPKI